MNIVDIAIIILLIIYLLKGLNYGVIKELVSFVGGLAVLVIAFLLKNPLSVLLYEHAPFFKFSGILSGISVLNILVYEIISFMIIASVLMIIFKIVLGVTNILELILKATVILEIPSKILGAVVGLLEGVLVTFIILFICNQFDYTRNYINESKYGDVVLTKTPVLAKVSEPIYNSAKEIYDLANEYKDSTDKEALNLQALDILLKYDIVEVNNVDILIEKNKLNIENIDTVLEKYREA